jgi:NAD(P)H-dependent flavin oxidoreductase YrpB (nitropropane dioxygenase family)
MAGRLSEILAIEVPIVQAPIGTAATPSLAAAVANAGGLGMLALSWSRPEQIRDLIRATRSLTARPFGVNLVLEWPQQERLRVVLEEGVRIVSTFWGNPAEYVSVVHAAGAKLIHTAGTFDEAAQAVAAGVDILVAQGVEAGGHVRGSTPLQQLLSELTGAFPAIPVIAAGGLADVQDIAAARVAGAEGAWLGTRFVCSVEANAAAIYQDLIIGASADDTVLTTLFARGWPDAPHRVLRNSTIRACEAAGRAMEPVAEIGDIVARTASGAPVERYAFALPTRTMTGDLEAMALYAGLGVDRIRDVQPARDLVQTLAAGFL